MRNLSYANDSDLHENETACRTHFHMKGFAPRLVLKQRQKRTLKWPILYIVFGTCGDGVITHAAHVDVFMENGNA